MAYWLLQGNPQTYDTTGALHAGTVDRWRVARHLHDISGGDEFALWISGPGGGVYALGVVTEPPERDVDPDAFWVDPADGSKLAWRIGIRIGRRLGSPIPRADLRADPGFNGSMIMRMPGGGNPFPVTPDEWQVIQSHITAAEAQSPRGETR
jgi:predicted RNA-binding protein with PUA-like domain